MLDAIDLDAANVRVALARLRGSNVIAFGAESHGFLLNPVLQEKDVAEFEYKRSVRLPDDYRHFLTLIGNGGAGPYYGIFPLGRMDEGYSLQTWEERVNLIGVLAHNFPFQDAWNEVGGMPADELLDKDQDEYERQFEVFEKKYWRPIDGAIPICHEGCAIRIWLIVTGPLAGHLWRDRRSEYAGFEQLRLANGKAASFSSWYNEWLQSTIETNLRK